MLVYVNGRFVEEAEAVVPVLDRGFLFGDGVYEVWRVVHGRLFEAERHQARLERGLRELAIAQPDDTRADALLAIAERLFTSNGLTGGEATLYVEVTRGAAPRTHAFPPKGTAPTVVVMARALRPNRALCESGGAAITVPDLRWLRCDIKTIQLLPNVMANQQAKDAGATESIFVRDGRITEGTHTSIFGVIEGTLRTHPLDRSVLPGVTRAVVLEMAQELGVPVAERAISVDELSSLEELFLCGTTTDVTPLVRLDGQPVGDGRPGPITVALYRGLSSRLSAFAAPAIR